MKIRTIIEGGLWQGGRRTIRRLNRRGRWARLEVRGVLNVARAYTPAYATLVPVLHLPALDRMNVPPEWFDAAVAFHVATLGKTFVHCRAGQNRSSVFSAAIRLATANFDVPRADWFTLNPRIPHRTLVMSLERWVDDKRP